MSDSKYTHDEDPNKVHGKPDTNRKGYKRKKQKKHPDYSDTSPYFRDPSDHYIKGLS